MTSLYKDIQELVKIARRSLNPAICDMGFIDSVEQQYHEKGALSDKQIKALENIAKRELARRSEEATMTPLFKL